MHVGAHAVVTEVDKYLQMYDYITLPESYSPAFQNVSQLQVVSHDS